jgi:predicted dehydrogenase
MSVAPFPPLSVSRSRSPLAGRPLRVAVIGAGAMGKRHARVIASCAEQFELVAVMDVDPRAALEVAGAHGIEPATREADAIAQADALVVATPAVAHALSVRRALAAGRHVLVEKPIARNAREAAELVALAASRGAHLCVGHSERFNPVVRALARLVDPVSVASLAFRRVGTARHAAAVLSSPHSTSAKAAPAEGALVNLGVHDFDLAAYLARSPLTSIQSSSDGAAIDQAITEDRADVFARTESGAPVHFFVDQRPADGVRRRAITLRTATHVWEGNLLLPSLVRTCVATGSREAIPLDTEEPLLAQALAFKGAVSGGARNEIATGDDGMRALLVAECARRGAV